MQENATALQGIFGIEPLVSPLLVTVEANIINILVGIVIMAIVFGALLIFVRYRYFSVRGRASRELAALQTEFERHYSDEHKTVFLLADILRRGLQLQKISIETLLPEKCDSQNSRWSIFVKTLYAARYSVQVADPSQINRLFAETQYWLRHWPMVKRNND